MIDPNIPTPCVDAEEHFFTDIDGVTQAVIDSDKARQLERELAACRDALERLRTSPNVLPMMSGERFTNLQLCELIDATLAATKGETV